MIAAHPLANGGVVFGGPPLRGSLAFREFSNHFCGVLCAGIQLEDLARSLTPALETSAKGAPVRLFIDTERVTGYETGFREHWTSWRKTHRHALSEVHMLVCSRIVRMGIQIATIATGNSVKCHGERREFELAMAPQSSSFRAFANEVTAFVKASGKVI